MATFEPKNGLKLMKINQNRALKLMKSSNIGHASVSIYTPPETRAMTSYLEKNVQFWSFFMIFGIFTLNRELLPLHQILTSEGRRPARRLKFGRVAPQA